MPALAAQRAVRSLVDTSAALLAVQPVNFIVLGDAVIIRTVSGSKLAAATCNSVVAFQVDEIDSQSQDRSRGVG